MPVASSDDQGRQACWLQNDQPARASVGQTAVQEPVEESCTQCSSEMRAPLAPVEARPAKLTALSPKRVDINAELHETRSACSGEFDFWVVDDELPLNQHVVKADGVLACQMIVAYPGCPQCGIPWPGSHRNGAGVLGQGHKAFEHLTYFRPCEANVAMPALAGCACKGRFGQSREMSAGCLQGDAGDLG